MSAAEQLHRPIMRPSASLDKVGEAMMAELVGTTQRALIRKRQRKVIPEGVWMKVDGRILYSISRYEAWLESLWNGPQVSSPSVRKSASASCGTASAIAKPSPTRKPPKASSQQPVFVLR